MLTSERAIVLLLGWVLGVLTTLMIRAARHPIAQRHLRSARNTFVQSISAIFNRGVWCAAIIIIQPLLFCWRILISQTAHIPWDLPTFHAPLAAQIVEAIKNGRMPLWDPYVYAGYPLHADLAAQLFYPPAWLVFVAGAFREHAIFYWLEWLTALHMILAGAGAFWLMRRLSCSRGAALFGATTFQLGCFFASQIQHLGAVASASWLPLAWLGVVALFDGLTGRRVAALGIVLAMVFLAGFPALTLVAYASTAAVALGYSITRRHFSPAVGVMAAFLLAALVCSVQLLPTLELSSMSAAGERWRWNDAEGVTPRAILSAVWPDYLHVFTPYDKSKFTEPANFTFLYFYNGQFAFWLAMLSLFLRKSGRGFAVLAALALLIVCGGHLPGYAAIFQLLPKFVRNAAYIEFALAAYSLGIAVAASMTLQRIVGDRQRVMACLAILVGVELLLVASNRPMNSGEGGWRRNDSPRQIMKQRELLISLKQLVNETAPPYRTDTVEWSPRFTMGAPLFRLPSANGDNPFAPRRMLAYRGLYTKVIPWERQYPIEDFASPLIGASSVGFIMSNGRPLDERIMHQCGWSRVAVQSKEALNVYRNERVLPRYRLVGEVRAAHDANEALKLLKTIDPHSAVVVEGAPSIPLAPLSDTGRIWVTAYRPERIDLAVSARTSSYLVLAEGYAPGWTATVDGKSSKLYPTNVAFMGLPVPPGEHRVSIEYRSRSLLFGALLSALASAIAATLLCRTSKKAVVP